MMTEEEKTAFYKSFDGLSLTDISRAMNDTRVALDAATVVKKDLQEKYDILRLSIVPSAMEEQEITNLTVEGIGRVGLTSDIYASLPAGNREQGYTWLKENGLGDIIRPTINAGTLKATIKALLKKGEIILPEGVFKVTPFTRASITKK